MGLSKIFFAILLSSFIITASNAYQDYLMRLPNSDKIPCATGTSCPASNHVCGGFGHSNCLNGGTNRFGDHFNKQGRSTWNVRLCQTDSDGDGKTNGDEMGDPCCRWNRGDTPDVVTDISNPDAATSTTSRPSCFSAVPNTPTFGAILPADIGSTKVRLSWTAAPGTCTCSYVLSVTDGSTVLYSVSNIRSTFSGAATEYVACGLNPGTLYTFSLSSINIQGGSASAATTTATTAASTNAVDDVSCSAQTFTILPAGTVGNPTWFPIHTVVIIVFIGLILILGYVINKRLTDPGSRTRYWSLHQPIHRGRADTWWKQTFAWILNMTYVQLIFAILFLGVCFAVFAWAFHMLADWIYPFGMPARTLRSLGYMLYVPFIFVFIPVTKFSIWIHVVGIPFERGVAAHRWIGMFAFLFSLAHGIGMDIELAKSYLGAKQIVNFDMIILHPLPGLLGGIFLVIGMSGAFEPLRRKYRGYFKITHYATLIAMVFFIIHIHVFYVLAPSFVVYLFDLGIILYDGYKRPAHVVSASIVEGKSSHEEYVHLHLKKDRFTCTPGQYVYIMIPSISRIAHPFSIAWSEASKHHPSSDFHLVIKPMGPKTWTGKLVEIVRKNELPVDHRVFCYGPIGRPSVTLTGCSEVVLFAGGIGVTPMISMFHAAVHELQNETSTLKKATFVFSFREVALWELIQKELLRDAKDLLKGKLVISLFSSSSGVEKSLDASKYNPAKTVTITPAHKEMKVISKDVEGEDGHTRKSGDADKVNDPRMSLSGPEKDHSSEDGSEGDEYSSKLDRASGIEIITGRPNIKEILEQKALESPSSDGGNATVAIGVCGPHTMIDEVEVTAARLNVSKSSKRKLLVHSETFFL